MYAAVPMTTPACVAAAVSVGEDVTSGEEPSEESALASPVAAVYYERYDDIQAVERSLLAQADHIQCIVGHGHVPFGAAQCPGPGEYADGVDTLRFLLDLN